MEFSVYSIRCHVSSQVVTSRTALVQVNVLVCLPSEVMSIREICNDNERTPALGADHHSQVVERNQRSKEAPPNDNS